MAVKELSIGSKRKNAEKKVGCLRLAITFFVNVRFKQQIAAFQSEAQLLSECKHVNVALLYGTCISSFQSFIIMEFCQGLWSEAKISKCLLERGSINAYPALFLGNLSPFVRRRKSL